MGKSCCVVTCKKTKGSDISYMTVPKIDNRVCPEWRHAILRAAGRPISDSKNRSICSKHFPKESLNSSGSGVTIMAGHVPIYDVYDAGPTPWLSHVEPRTYDGRSYQSDDLEPGEIRLQHQTSAISNLVTCKSEPASSQQPYKVYNSHTHRVAFRTATSNDIRKEFGFATQNNCTKVEDTFDRKSKPKRVVVCKVRKGESTDYISILRKVLHINPNQGSEFAKMLITEMPSIDVDKIIDVFMMYNQLEQCTEFLLDHLKHNQRWQGPMQTKLLELNLTHAPKVADDILKKKTLTYYNRIHIARLCEKAGLYQSAFENYTHQNDKSRVIAQISSRDPELLLSLFGSLSAWDTVVYTKAIKSSCTSRSHKVCAQIVTKYHERFTSHALASIFTICKSCGDLREFLRSILNAIDDPEARTKYVDAACGAGFKEVATEICKELPFQKYCKYVEAALGAGSKEGATEICRELPFQKYCKYVEAARGAAFKEHMKKICNGLRVQKNPTVSTSNTHITTDHNYSIQGKNEPKKVIVFIAKNGLPPNSISILKQKLSTNPKQGLEFAKLVLAGENPQPDIQKIIDVFTECHKIELSTELLLDMLKTNRSQQRYLQTKLLEVNLIHAPKVADDMLRMKLFTSFDRSYVAYLCEKAGLLRRALEIYRHSSNIKRVIARTNSSDAEWLVDHCSSLDDCRDIVLLIEAILMRGTTWGQRVCSQMLSKYHERFTTDSLVCVFQLCQTYGDFNEFLRTILTSSKEAKIQFKFIEAAFRIENKNEVEEICRELRIQICPKLQDRVSELCKKRKKEKQTPFPKKKPAKRRRLESDSETSQVPQDKYNETTPEDYVTPGDEQNAETDNLGSSVPFEPDEGCSSDSEMKDSDIFYRNTQQFNLIHIEPQDMCETKCHSELESSVYNCSSNLKAKLSDCCGRSVRPEIPPVVTALTVKEDTKVIPTKEKMVISPPEDNAVLSDLSWEPRIQEKVINIVPQDTPTSEQNICEIDPRTTVTINGPVGESQFQGIKSEAGLDCVLVKQECDSCRGDMCNSVVPKVEADTCMEHVGERDSCMEPKIESTAEWRVEFSTCNNSNFTDFNFTDVQIKTEPME